MDIIRDFGQVSGLGQKKKNSILNLRVTLNFTCKCYWNGCTVIFFNIRLFFYTKDAIMTYHYATTKESPEYNVIQ